MRIGAFAEHFQLNKSTIRYYTDINLLIPEKTNKYANYDDVCLKDMKDIIDLKNMGFSIEEIQMLKSYERFNINSPDDNSFCNQIIENKIDELKTSITNIKNQILDIEHYKSNLRNKISDKPLGLPLNALSVLSCPTCNSPFSIRDASIDDNMIFSGRLQCSCNHAFFIENGIITTTHIKDLQLKPNFKTNFESDEYIHRVTNEHIALFRKTGNLITQYFEKWDHSKGILFANADVDLLIMQMDQFFQEDGIYIFSSYDINSLIELKNTMERDHLSGTFIYIYTVEAIPINISVPYVIDNVGNLFDFMTDQDAGHSIQRLSSLANENSEWLFIHLGSNNINKLTKIQEHKYPYILEKTYLDYYKNIGMIPVKTEEIGDFHNIDNFTEQLKGFEALKLKLILLRYEK